MHPNYHEWVDYIFAHGDPVDGFLDLDEPPYAESDADQVALITDTFRRSGTDLTRFSDAQVNQSMWHLVSSSSSDYMFSIRDGDVPIEQRVAAIHSIFPLYRDCFAKRCTEVLSHLDERGASSLNAICYMFWDVCPLGYLDNSPDIEKLENAVMSVLEQTVRIPHRACIEGALHGFSEFSLGRERRVKNSVDAFLSTADLDHTLRSYAEAASEGGVL